MTDPKGGLRVPRYAGVVLQDAGALLKELRSVSSSWVGFWCVPLSLQPIALARKKRVAPLIPPGIFKEELGKVVYGDEHYLSTRKDIDEIWRKVTRALHQSAFPELEQKIEAAIKGSYLPINQNYYYRNVRRNITLEWQPGETTGIFKAITKIDAEIVPKAGQSLLHLKGGYGGKPIPKFSGNRYTLTEFSVDGTNLAINRPARQISSDDDGNERWEYEFELLPAGNRPLKVVHRQTSVSDISVDNTLQLNASSYIDGLQVFVSYDKMMDVVFRSHGGASFKTTLALPDADHRVPLISRRISRGS